MRQQKASLIPEERVSERRRATLFAGARVALSAALLGTLSVGAAQAADATYPVRPIRMIVPFPAGAGADAIARMIAQRISTSLGQAVVVDNRGGANGLIGVEALSRATPDGYTIALVDRSVLGINPSLYKKLPYDPLKDLDYFGIAAWAPYLLVVNPSIPVKTFNDLVKYSKQVNVDVNYGSFGVGSLPQIDMELLKSNENMKLTQVPYKGASPAIAATIGGEVSVTLSSIGSLLGNVKEGRLRAIAVGSSKRSPLLPDVPTIEEAGGNAESLMPTYFGFAGPKGLPQPVKEKLLSAIQEAVASPEISRQIQALGMEPASVNPAELSATVQKDVANFRKIAASLGIQPE